MTAHEHPRAESRGRLAIALGITVAILLAEVVGAALTGSLALIVDAGHVLTDAGGLAIALLASALAARPASARRSWGFARAEVLAATLQAAVLLAVGLFVLVEGVRRLVEPPVVEGGPLLVFGLIGLAGNLASLAVLLPRRRADLNLRAAFLEVANDALGSLGVVVAAVVIALTGWRRADAVAAILIGVLILPRALRLLREAVDVLLESTPASLDTDDLRRHLVALPYVREVHDLHVSRISSGLPVLTAHVTVERDCFEASRAPALLDELQRCVAEHFDPAIEHSTFQLEPAAHREHEHAPHA